MTAPNRIDEIQARWAKISPWFWWTSNSYRRLGTQDQERVVMYATVCRDGVGTIEGDESALDAIASAPSDIAWLVERVRELENGLKEAIDGYTEALSYKMDHLVKKHGDGATVTRLRALLAKGE